MPYHLCICVKRSTCVCHYLWQEWSFRLHAFIFLCRTNPWVKYPWNSIFFNFEGMLYWYEMKAYIFENLFLSYFFYLTLVPTNTAGSQNWWEFPVLIVLCIWYKFRTSTKKTDMLAAVPPCMWQFSWKLRRVYYFENIENVNLYFFLVDKIDFVSD